MPRLRLHNKEKKGIDLNWYSTISFKITSKISCYLTAPIKLFSILLYYTVHTFSNTTISGFERAHEVSQGSFNVSLFSPQEKGRQKNSLPVYHPFKESLHPPPPVPQHQGSSCYKTTEVHQMLVFHIKPEDADTPQAHLPQPPNEPPCHSKSSAVLH